MPSLLIGQVFFLPKQTYQKCSALYDFCRVVDNIADDDDTIESKKNKFKKFENNFNNKNFDDPIIKLSLIHI